MNNGATDLNTVLIVAGLVVILSVPIRAALERLGFPAMIGFVGLGIAISGAFYPAGASRAGSDPQFELLANLGIVFLLFKVGLESNLDLLLKQLKRAAYIWLPNIAVAGVVGFLVVFFWPGMGLVPALFVGVATSATSIGVSIAVWDDAGRLNTDEGALLLDVAELDDVSSIVLLSMLLAVAPLLRDADPRSVLPEALASGAMQLAKLFVFALGCYIFSRLFEKRLSAFFAAMRPEFGAMVFAAGVAIIVATIANVLGFSLAIGAMFAGLAFSRDPNERDIDDAFALLLAIFGPFFFVAIGLSMDLAEIGDAIALGLVLSTVAIVGKLIGAGIPAGLLLSRQTGVRIGWSMVPRAEIFLLVMLYGLTLGTWAVPPILYNAAVMASLVTCLIGPVMASRSLRSSSHSGRTA